MESGSKMDFDTLDEGLSRIAKKQKTVDVKAIADINNILVQLNSCKKIIALHSNDMETDDLIPKAISKLNQTVVESQLCTKITNDHRETHAPISKFGKLLEKSFRSDIEKSTKDLEFDKPTLNEIIINHLYRAGRFDLGDLFVEESGFDADEAKRTKDLFIDQQRIVCSIENYNLDSAIKWSKENREALKGINSGLEFKLHRMQFLYLLSMAKQNEALQYARQNFSEFSNTNQKDIQNLMGAFIYANRLESSPYASIFQVDSIENSWREVKSTFTKDSSTLMGVAQESPLSITITVGVRALPTFLKLSSFAMLKGANDDSLTVEINVDENYKFHSIFACPVSREQSTKVNPPVMLQCGHLLCRNSMQRLLKSASTRFKCPYCPTEQSLGNVKTVNF